MKTIFILLLPMALLTGSHSFAQQHPATLKSDITFGNDFVFTTFLTVEQTGDRFVLTTPKNADVRVFGWFKARLGRLLGRIPRKGIFATITTTRKGDRITGNVVSPMLGKLAFTGFYRSDSLHGEIWNGDSMMVGTIEGRKNSERDRDYEFLFSKVMDITQRHIFSEQVLHTEGWKKFENELRKRWGRAQDDIEVYLSFKTLQSQIPFSHYYLIFKDPKETEEQPVATSSQNTEPSVVYERKNTHTAYLKIRNFSSTEEELADIFPKIMSDHPANLIIDLRDNYGGGIEAAFEFGKYIMKDTVEVGYFVTNKLRYSGFDIDLFKTLPVARPETTEEFVDRLKSSKGAQLLFTNPGTTVFSGKIFILTNRNTASTCEPLVYLLKQTNRATIIGENTAGAMLSGALFHVRGKYHLFLPISDFYTYDGVRLEGLGVAPHIETSSENALDTALSLLNAFKPRE